jgi:hypothetical protein
MSRTVLVLLLLAGCSSESAAPADLAAGPPECMFVLGGAGSGTLGCSQRFCGQPTSGDLQLYGRTPNGPIVDLALDGPFMLGRSYTGADLKTFNASYREFSSPTTYVAGSSVAGSTVTLTITDAEQNPDASCGPNGDGTAHGSAHIGLVESDYDLDAGMSSPGPGRLTIDATF